MEIALLIFSTICISALVKILFNFFFFNKTRPKNYTLPPGPCNLPIVTTFWLLRKLSSPRFEHWLGSLQTRFGPIITLHIGPQPHIFIFSRALAHQALVQSGALFADRPKSPPATKILNRNQHNINSAGYGPIWRLLRRNLATEILHPSRVSSYHQARERGLHILVSTLMSKSQGGVHVNVAHHFQFSMFCLLATMCFGTDLGEKKIREIEKAQRSFLLALYRFQVLDLWPRVTKILLPGRWRELLQKKDYQEEIIIPLIQARKEAKNVNKNHFLPYLDSLLELELQKENGNVKKKLTDSEIVVLCSEFLNAGVDTTSTALQWIMANLVKYPHVQTRVFEEIQGIFGSETKEIREEDLEKLPYSKAVILEGLRRHPPGHQLLPHAVIDDAELGGYLVPKNATLHFMVPAIGRDPQVWENPMEFNPERFLGKEGVGFDIKSGEEIKMMPFGAGRRMCPGHNLGMLHLQYFVVNLVWSFEWKAVNGGEIDLSEKPEFTTVMKYPLVAQISPRRLI